MTSADLIVISRVRTLARSGAAKSIRVAAGLSLGEVASSLGTSPSTVLRWERGERRPRGALALRYAALLDDLMRPSARR